MEFVRPGKSPQASNQTATKCSNKQMSTLNWSHPWYEQIQYMRFFYFSHYSWFRIYPLYTIMLGAQHVHVQWICMHSSSVSHGQMCTFLKTKQKMYASTALIASQVSGHLFLYSSNTIQAQVHNQQGISFQCYRISKWQERQICNLLLSFVWEQYNYIRSEVQTPSRKYLRCSHHDIKIIFRTSSISLYF